MAGEVAKQCSVVWWQFLLVLWKNFILQLSLHAACTSRFVRSCSLHWTMHQRCSACVAAVFFARVVDMRVCSSPADPSSNRDRFRVADSSAGRCCPDRTKVSEDVASSELAGLQLFEAEADFCTVYSTLYLCLPATDKCSLARGRYATNIASYVNGHY